MNIKRIIKHLLLTIIAKVLLLKNQSSTYVNLFNLTTTNIKVVVGTVFGMV
jgi:hypothetical protein